MDPRPRPEAPQGLLDPERFEDLPVKWQAAILEAEANSPKLRLISRSEP
jgi:hypothetical protein